VVDRPVHAPLTQFPVVDDELVVGGLPIRELAARIGQTPFYAYDRAALSSRMQELRDGLPSDLSIHYAIKANPMPAVVEHMATLVDGMDVASRDELHIALDSGTAPLAISFAGPGKSDADLHDAVATGVTLNLESEGEFRRCLTIGERLGIAPRVAVRVNPDFELKSSGMKMGGGSKPFGIDVELVPALLEEIGHSDAHFRGFHIYGGSQNLNADTLIAAQTATFDLALKLAEHAPGPLETLNIGGGFGIPYFPGERPLDLAPVGDALEGLLRDARSRLGATEVICELGRYLVGEAGIYVCTVIDKKVSRGRTYLVTNGGLHHHLAASGNFGQVIRKNYPLVIGHRVAGEPREEVSVVGPLCTPLDVLGERMNLGRAEIGDLVVVLQSGAYGYSASPHGFLGHPPPLEALV
jgi:diaminopimelate decarboxylase